MTAVTLHRTIPALAASAAARAGPSRLSSIGPATTKRQPPPGLRLTGSPRRARPEVSVAPCANSFALEPDPAANDVEEKLANRMGADSPRRRGSPGSGTPNFSPPDYIRAVPTVDLPDDELAAVTAAIRGVIQGDPYPRAPRLVPMRTALAKFEAATVADADCRRRGRRVVEGLTVGHSSQAGAVREG
jgi:hypothetical protein